MRATILLRLGAASTNPGTRRQRVALVPGGGQSNDGYLRKSVSVHESRNETRGTSRQAES